MNDSQSSEVVNGVIVAFVIIVTAFAAWFGMIGFGLGAFIWGVREGIGLGMLTTGAGSLFGAMFGGKRILRAICTALPGSSANVES